MLDTRGFATGLPLLWVFRAVVALVAFGGFWLSMRGQHPYTGRPGGWALAVAFTLVAVNIGWSIVAIRRAGAGVSGPAQRRRRAFSARRPRSDANSFPALEGVAEEFADMIHDR